MIMDSASLNIVKCLWMDTYVYFLAVKLFCHRIGQHFTLLSLAKKFSSWVYQLMLPTIVYESCICPTSFPALGYYIYFSQCLLLMYLSVFHYYNKIPGEG